MGANLIRLLAFVGGKATCYFVLGRLAPSAQGFLVCTALRAVEQGISLLIARGTGLVVKVRPFGRATAVARPMLIVCWSALEGDAGRSIIESRAGRVVVTHGEGKRRSQLSGAESRSGRIVLRLLSCRRYFAVGPRITVGRGRQATAERGNRSKRAFPMTQRRYARSRRRAGQR